MIKLLHNEAYRDDVDDDDDKWATRREWRRREEYGNQLRV